PITITSATLSDTNPNGVIHIDATGATAGETATIRVTATEPSTHSTAVQTFKVTVGPDTTTHASSFTFKPLAYPISQSVPSGTATTIQLARTGTTQSPNSGNNQNPGNSAISVQFALVSQPGHGTISNFNATTGSLVYTPAAGFT